MQAASAALETAANGLNQVFQNASNPLTSGSTMGDSVDLSTAMLGMLKSNLNFTANVKMAVVENSMARSTFSILG